MEFVDTFEGVVEGDDRTVAGVFLDIIDHILSGEPLGVVTGNQVPHHNLVLSTQPGILT